MAKQPRPWIVTPHTALQKLEDNLWLLESNVPGTPMRRRMTIIRRSDGTLVFYQAVPMNDATLAEIRTLGKPAILIVPHDQHGMDATAFAEKLGVEIYGPKKNEEKLRKKFQLAGTVEDLPPDPALMFEAVEGSKTGEPVAIVRSTGGRVSLIFADAYMATPSQGTALPLRIMGFAGGPKVAPIFKWLFVSDLKALKAHLTRLASTPGLTHLVPCHGLVESRDAAGTLKRAAAAA
jgi:hypothetical protein